ncbi:MAG: hypothetical protein A3F13_02120 [Gammaproteobacteria bacterium RIFCSPHIGHO2_12_FULL_40_19]|nr:MAG: hypothetical protein A3F13_02120 [Gammaproteobacteria bacterium RIFCSPHIGHO2_12_FULL_40_19]
MLDGYVSEKEQIDAIQKWWRENGKWITVAVIVGLVIGFGWRYWHTMQLRRAENASVIYQSVLEADSQNQAATVQGGAALLMKDFSSSPYASLAALLLVKESVAQNDLKKASSQLQWVIDHSNQKRLQQIAHISRARILLSEGKTHLAMNELNIVSDKSFEPLINWVKGDIFVQEGNVKEAQKYYTLAKNALPEFPSAVDFMDKQIAQPI